jgi:hypothetical protein
VAVTAGSVTMPPSPRPSNAPTGNDAIYTDILSVNLTDGSGTSVTRGAAAPTGYSPMSLSFLGIGK